MNNDINYKSKEDWISEGKSRFGENFENWKFKCPHCGKISSGKEFKEAGATPNDMYSCCIGRFVSDRGCDWAAWGFLDICSTHVAGVPVFDFAESDTKENAADRTGTSVSGNE